MSDGLPEVASTSSPSTPRAPSPRTSKAGSAGIAVAALGVVFGDIGTSPLYTLKTCFTTANVTATPDNVLGIVSLLVWTLAFVVCVKYVGVLLRVDHEGEGGILALLALAHMPRATNIPPKATALTWIVVIGAVMLFGDGIITPAISVISAVEGIRVATPAASAFVVPAACGLLIALFAIQSRGTQRVGSIFGPVMVAWFLAIGIVGLIAVVHAPQALSALDPRHAIDFVAHHGVFGFLVFGAIVLAVTGVEALYADLSHFGRGPITLAWYALVFPALVLNYLGQGGTLLVDAKHLDSPFYALAGGWLLLPMVALATAATIIASQALISGAFTLTEQAINLSLWPRMTVHHTSRRNRGQVYVPAVNALLAIGCIALVLTFRSSDRLAAAYGLAVSATMLATSLAFYVVVTRKLGWDPRITTLLVSTFVLLDVTFVAASLPKFLDGAWIPLMIAVFFGTTAMTWLEGRRCVAKRVMELQVPVDEYIRDSKPMTEEPLGTMVFLTRDPAGFPFVGNQHRWIGARAAKERVVLLTLLRSLSPYVAASERVKITHRSARVTSVEASFGFMERPNITPVLRACGASGLNIDNEETSFFYADPKIVRAAENPMPGAIRRYFEFLARNARPLPDDLEIRAERRVELGIEVAI